MRILDRYIIKSIIAVFFACFFTFLFLYIVIDILSHLDDILRQHVQLKILLQYYLSYLPIIFTQVAPFSCLLSTLYTFAKLNRENEIIAMRASGLSVMAIAKTVIIFGFIVSLLVFWVNDRFVPSSMILNQKIKAKMEGGQKIASEKETVTNLSVYGMGNRLFFINEFTPAAKTMRDIVILEHDQQQDITKKIVAKKGEYKGISWIFSQVITYEFDKKGAMKKEPRYAEEEIMAIPETPQEFLTQRQSPDLMTISQLNDYIWKLSRSGAAAVVRSLKVDLYQRYTAPLLSIIMIFLAIPFAFKIKKRATGVSSLGVSIIAAFMYYVLNAVSVTLGKGGFFPPLLAASLSHIVILSLSLHLIFALL